MKVNLKIFMIYKIRFSIINYIIIGKFSYIFINLDNTIIWSIVSAILRAKMQLHKVFRCFA